MEDKGVRMDVIYISNNIYAQYMGISMLSLFDHNQDLMDITVYVLSQEIDLKNRKYLYAIADRYHRTIEFIDVSGFEKEIPFRFSTSGYNSVVLARLFLCSYLPGGVSRALYLDCDTVVNGSLKKLEKIAFGHNLIAAVPELYMPVHKKNVIGLKKNETYFNAGVLLINLKLWRSMKMESVFVDYYRMMKGQLLYNDQDIINHCCKGRILTLSQTYNLSPNMFYFPRFFVKKMQPAYDLDPPKRYADILSSPVIIHYLGDERPWIEGNHNRYRKQYEYYWKKSPWKRIPRIQGRRFYMFCYHVLNIITRFCPWFRVLFSNLIGVNIYKWFGRK